MTTPTPEELRRIAAEHEAELLKRIRELEELLRSACAIAERQGASTSWPRFLASAAKLGINGITARTYRLTIAETLDANHHE